MPNCVLYHALEIHCDQNVRAGLKDGRLLFTIWQSPEHPGGARLAWAPCSPLRVIVHGGHSLGFKFILAVVKPEALIFPQSADTENFSRLLKLVQIQLFYQISICTALPVDA